MSQSAVHLNLFLTLTASRSTTAFSAAGTTTLAVQVLPHARHTRQRVLHAGQVHLHHRLTCPTGKNIQNDLFAVNHGHVDQLFPLTLLGGRKQIIKNHAVSAQFLSARTDFLCLTNTAEVFRLQLAGELQTAFNNANAQITHQIHQFRQQRLTLATRLPGQGDAYQQRPLHHIRLLANLKRHKPYSKLRLDDTGTSRR